MSIPPSQRSVRKNAPQRWASASTIGRSCFLVQMNKTRSPRRTMLRTAFWAPWRRSSVLRRSMMWMPFFSVKMNLLIFGFQRRVWCPKWTPASSN